MKRVWLVLVALALAALSGPAQAQTGVSEVLFGFPAGATVLSETSMSAQVQGEVVVSFRGDAAAGCATYGLCSYAGTVVVRPQGAQLTVVTFRQHGRIGHAAALLLGTGESGYTTSARVQRAAPGGQGGTCADAHASTFGPSIPTLAHGRSITIRLMGRGGSLLQTRCAGPLDGDLAAVSPAVTLPVARALRGRTALDLSGTRTFATHGFAGTISSTLVLHLGRPQRQPSGASFPPGIKTHRMRIVTEHLRLIGVTGQLGVAIRGTDDPIVCQLLDSCGLTGTLRLGPLGGGMSAQVIAQGPASRPYRDFLTVLKGGHERGISALLLVNVLGGVAETTTQAGATCTDTSGTGGIAALTGALPALRTGFGAFAGPWRTRCPGPLLGDRSAGVRASLAVGALAHRQFTLRLRATGSLSDDGYVMSAEGDLSVLLRRGRITQQVITAPGG